ncbi:cytochrome b [Marinobacterium mangrovicola]|uniref:Cytochrome b561 n=1 Tax=Marinobacterium mangrovicola TaxID=1476959 RepID=A0A4R1GWD1_9GAMM|nr:cytochrome b [Marinobacterium mangrovicola]TCK08722.1 cytochrome b561 [Marinobacterium mangrovicola]
MTAKVSLRNSANRYGLVTILIHWVMALAIIGMYPLGLYIDSLSYYDPAYRTVPHWHKSIGMLIFAALFIRLIWKMLNPQPKPLPSHGTLVRLLTKLGHLGLYLLMFVALASGYMISTADGAPIEVFNWFGVPALPEVVERQEDVAGAVHYWVATALIVLAGLHALAALKHHFIDKDETLSRIFNAKQEK